MKCFDPRGHIRASHSCIVSEAVDGATRSGEQCERAFATWTDVASKVVVQEGSSVSQGESATSDAAVFHRLMALKPHTPQRARVQAGSMPLESRSWYVILSRWPKGIILLVLYRESANIPDGNQNQCSFRKRYAMVCAIPTYDCGASRHSSVQQQSLIRTLYLPSVNSCRSGDRMHLVRR